MSEQLIAELREQIKALRDENAKRRSDNKTLKTQNAELTTNLAAAGQKVTDLEGKVGKTPPELQTRIDELTSENRGLKHKGAFKERAIADGVLPEAVDTLYAVSGYKADTDEVVAETLGSAIEGARTSHPFLFKPAEGAGGSTPPPPPKPPLGGDRGGSVGATAKFRVSQAQVADPAWMHANQDAYRAAGKAGTLAFTD